MTDMHATVIPKSDQLNYDDLAGGRIITVKITKVSGKSGDQPICMNYEGDNGKPYYPCKSMRRVMIHNWGGNGAEYVGRYLTLYGDPTVKFGGLEVGGIRISHMSHLTKEVTMALTASRANKKPFTVKPLAVEQIASLDDMLHDIEKAPDLDGLKFKFNAAVKAYPNDKDKITAAKDKRKTELTEGAAVP